MYYDHEVWPYVSHDDLWIFDKCILSRKLGYICGPAGVKVPKTGKYVVRPCVNLEGMGKGAKIVYLEQNKENSEKVPPGYFWQELFEGRHLSFDFVNGKQVRATEGFRESDSLQFFTRWITVDDQLSSPDVVQYFIDKYSYVNVEAVDGKIIEVHLRKNPDFDDGSIEIIPVWENQKVKCPAGFVFVPDIVDDKPRLGFFKRYKQW